MNGDLETSVAMDDSILSLGMDASGMSPGLSSLPCTPVEDERPGSSLSTASRTSKIPVLTRSASLRIKNSDSRPGLDTPKTRAPQNAGRGIVRSASFVSSRGLAPHTPTSPPSNSFSTSSPFSPSTSSSATTTRHSTPSSSRIYGNSLTPEAPRRYSYAGGHYSGRRTSAGPSPGERKTHSFAGAGSSPWYPSLSYHHNHHNHHFGHHLNHTNTLRRPNYLPVSAGPSSLPHTTVSQSDTPSRSPDLDLDDGDSVKSFGSVSSAISCDAAFVRSSSTHHRHSHGHGHNSAASSSSCSSSKGKNMRYALHCPHNHDTDPENYLTPTQRAARRIRELKSQLAEARREVHERDAEISRLTRELVELRLLKARAQQREDDAESAPNATSEGLTSKPDSHENSSQRDEAQKRLSTEGGAASSTTTPKTSATPSEGSEPELSRLMDNLTIGGSDSGTAHNAAESPAAGSVAETTVDSVDLTRSLADSGHYEDLTSPCLSSKDPFEPSQSSLRGRPIDEDEDEQVDPWAAVEEAEARLREEYERREDQLKRNHMDEYHELKEKHNDRVESLLSKLSDANLKYFELRPMYDRSQERARELERDVGKLKEELTEAELRHQKMYLQMFLKGQQAARLQADDDQDGEDGSQSSLSSGGPMVDLMKQLARTEEELEKVKGVSFLPSSLSSPGFRGLPLASLGASNAALLDGKQAIYLYFQGRKQALYRRELAMRNNNNNTRNGELDPEVTLQFLKSAIYYFLTDKDNSRGHLRAIESILGYSDSEKYNIDRVVK